MTAQVLPVVYTFAGDESGDVSFSFTKGASRHFIFSMIASEDPEELRGSLQQLRVENHLSADYEFKYHNLTSQRLKSAVFDCLSHKNFQTWALIVEKTSLPDSFRFMSGLDFYLYFVAELIQAIPPEFQENATLFLDEFGGKKNIAVSIRKVLRIRNMKSSFKKIVSKRSEGEPLIQVADLVSGAISHRDSINNVNDFEKIQKRISKIITFS